jgi:hypothetical protein
MENMVVEIPAELEQAIAEAAERMKVSKEEFVIRAVRRRVGLHETPWNPEDAKNAVKRMSELNGPTCDIEQMLAEIESGRF